MSTCIFLDETGDLGWTLDQPFQKGGSSQFMVLAAVIASASKLHLLSRVIRGFYKQRRRALKSELKSTELNSIEKQMFITALTRIKTLHPDIMFATIVVKKSNVNAAFRRHPNGLYNYMTKLLLLTEMGKHPHVEFFPDARSIKSELKHSMHDYLITNLAECNFSTQLTTTPYESKDSLEIQFADLLSSITWSAYEYSDGRFAAIKQYVIHKELFFKENLTIKHTQSDCFSNLNTINRR